ncbi:MAG TPA: sugar transferase, partial [Pyrinomonadaceae bacterium]|nr:sugar transferase [Pyrinomonadaceae bacterium]
MVSRSGTISDFCLKLNDLTWLLVSLGLVIVFRYSPSANPGFVVDYFSQRIKVTNAILGVLLLLSWYAAFAAQGLYRSYRLGSRTNEIIEVARAVAICSVALLVAAEIGHWPTVKLRTTADFGLISFGLVVSVRMALRYNLRRLRERGHNVKSLVLVGGGARARAFAAHINQRQDLGYKVLGYVDSDPDYAGRTIEGARHLGTIEDLPHLMSTEIIDEVAIALPIKSHYTQIESAVGLLEEQGITAHVLSDLFPQKLARAHSVDFDGMPIVTLGSVPPFSWRTEAKRLMDLSASIILMVVSAPVFVLTAIAIRLDSSGPIFFVQERVGFNKRRFSMIKFRTMTVDAEARMEEIEHLNEKQGTPIFKIKNDPRITRVGRWLRKTSIDELPQLVNVLMGDMSIVGPRPLSVRDAVRMEEAWQKRRFSVKPGLTCLWQVSG